MDSALSPLSVFDLPIFFSERHRELGEKLTSMTIDDADASTIVGQLARAGLLEWLLPRHGALDIRALCLIRERLAAISVSADSIFAVHGLGTTPLRLAQQADHSLTVAQVKLLEGARFGTVTFGFALTEPEAGSDVASLRTRAIPVDVNDSETGNDSSNDSSNDNGYRLHGEKTLISNVGIATHYTVFANVDPAGGRRHITAFVVSANARGLTESPLQAICEHPLGALKLTNCLADSLIGLPGDGFRLAMQTLDRFRVTVGAAAVGMARAAFDAALAHVRGRVQFGSPLADKQLVQAKLADMSTELDAARLLVYRAAHALDHGERATRFVAQAKLYATEAGQRIIDSAVQLFGGRGVLAGERVEQLYRAIRPLRIYEGASDIQKLIIFKRLDDR